MGSEQSYPSSTMLPNCKLDEFQRLGFQLGNVLHPYVVVKSAPDGWRYQSGSCDMRQGTWYDESDIPRIDVFVKDTSYDKHCSASFLSKDESHSRHVEQVQARQNIEKFSKLARDLCRIHRDENCPEPFALYAFADGSERWNQYFQGISQERRSDIYEFHEIHLIGWSSRYEDLESLVTELQPYVHKFQLRIWDTTRIPMTRFVQRKLTGYDTFTREQGSPDTFNWDECIRT